MKTDLIYTRTDKWILSKQSVEWKKWQDKFYHYISSLSFTSFEELADFLKVDFKITDQNSIEIINKVNTSRFDYFELSESDGIIKIKEVPLDLLNSKGEIIDWKEWSYFFTKINNEEFHLWVYLGGIAEMVREIKLSQTQTNNWKTNGNEFIKTLATELQNLESNEYKNTIGENRKII